MLTIAQYVLLLDNSCTYCANLGCGMDRKWLSEKIQTYIKLSKGTRADLCAAVSLSERTLYSYETGQRTPRVAKAKALGTLMNFDWKLFYGD